MIAFARLLLGGSLLLGAVSAMANTLADARQLVDQHRYGEAIEIYQKLVAADPRNTDLLIETARVNGWADRNTEAARLYRQVVEVTPDRLPDIRRALAWQLRWSGQCKDAVTLFAAEIERFPDDADPRQGRAECALVTNRPASALADYDWIVNRDASNVRAATGRARALFWSGADEAALAALGSLQGPEVDALRRDVQREVGRRLTFGFETSSDSDDLDIRVFNVGLRYPLQARDYLLANLRTANVEQNGIAEHGDTILVGYGRLIGNPGAGLGALRVSAEGGARNYDPESSGAWRLHGTWLRSDVWRFDIEAGNEIIENIQSLLNRVQFNYASAGFDARPFDRWLFSAGVLAADFRDGNQRHRLHGRIEHRWRDAPRLDAGIEAFGFNDSDPPNPSLGYYNPDRYREGKLYLVWRPEAFGFGFRVKGAVGRLWESPGDASTLYAWEAGAHRNLNDRFRVDAWIGGSDSASLTSGPGGYRRHYGGAQIGWWF